MDLNHSISIYNEPYNVAKCWKKYELKFKMGKFVSVLKRKILHHSLHGNSYFFFPEENVDPNVDKSLRLFVIKKTKPFPSKKLFSWTISKKGDAASEPEKSREIVASFRATKTTASQA